MPLIVDATTPGRDRIQHAASTPQPRAASVLTMPVQLDPYSLLGALYAFYLEHQCCGELDGGVEFERVWMSCTCGAGISRTLDPAQPF